MANLHKTERKLLWWVRDGGLHSDWPQGGLGKILCSHGAKLAWHARHSNTLWKGNIQKIRIQKKENKYIYMTHTIRRTFYFTESM